MPKFIDITRRHFGRLVVVRRAGRNASKHTLWLCRCDCSDYCVVAGSNLKSGNTISCGCRGGGYRHGYQKHPLYDTWRKMLDRCNNPKNIAFKNYGARGITVCERWNDFTKFLADVGERPPGLVLDRTNNDSNYAPDNVRWTSWSESNKNQRRWKR